MHKVIIIELTQAENCASSYVLVTSDRVCILTLFRVVQAHDVCPNQKPMMIQFPISECAKINKKTD